ncbi:MAG: cupredoxin family copper-binding protein [Methylocystis sp.]|uniref:cupredoxin domain-containing protein n=1 Tax=Methylocystis sp. TaxID=1911079 RepID=UPI003953899A
MKLRIALSILLLTAPALGAEETKVTIDNFTFSPATLSVRAGTTIVFVNHDDLPHNVVDANGGFRSKALDTDETFARVFDKPGEFIYFCGLHPQMHGKIIVTP